MGVVEVIGILAKDAGIDTIVHKIWNGHIDEVTIGNVKKIKHILTNIKATQEKIKREQKITGTTQEIQHLWENIIPEIVEKLQYAVEGMVVKINVKDNVNSNLKKPPESDIKTENSQSTKQIDEFEQDQVYGNIALQQAEAGIFDESLKSAEKINDELGRSYVLCNIALQQAKAGKPKEEVYAILQRVLQFAEQAYWERDEDRTFRHIALIQNKIMNNCY